MTDIEKAAADTPGTATLHDILHVASVRGPGRGHPDHGSDRSRYHADQIRKRERLAAVGDVDHVDTGHHLE
jgi:hypothetical protein